VVRTRRFFEKEQRVRVPDVVERAQATTHPPPEVPPPVSNSTGKSCCSAEVVSEGAKKAKKESIAVDLGGVRGDLGSGVEEVVGWAVGELSPSTPLDLYTMQMHFRRHGGPATSSQLIWLITVYDTLQVLVQTRGRGNNKGRTHSIIKTSGHFQCDRTVPRVAVGAQECTYESKAPASQKWWPLSAHKWSEFFLIGELLRAPNCSKLTYLENGRGYLPIELAWPLSARKTIRRWTGSEEHTGQLFTPVLPIRTWVSGVGPRRRQGREHMYLDAHAVR